MVLAGTSFYSSPTHRLSDAQQKKYRITRHEKKARAKGARSHQQKQEEVAVVLFSDALVEPRTMVVEAGHTHVAHAAVLRSRRPASCRAVSHRREAFSKLLFFCRV